MQQIEHSPGWQASTSFRQLLACWPQLVGPAVAQHSQPNKIQKGILWVSVSSSAWAQTLTFERCRILEKLHRKIPATTADVQSIRFATARWRQLSQRSQPLVPSKLEEHPSWVKRPLIAPQRSPKTADKAFQDWSKQVRTQWVDQSLCPKCQCPCPTQELQRWSACAICMSRSWHNHPIKP